MSKIEKKIIPLEKDIQREICDYLFRCDYFFWRSNNIPVFGLNNGGNRTFRKLPKYTPRGLPDIIIIRKGLFIGLEVKRPGMKLRPEQAEFGLKCEFHGGIYRSVSSLKDVIQLFNSLDKIG